MLTRKQWGSRAVTEADLGTTIQITRPPQQYPISRIYVVLRGEITIGAVGAVDYVSGDEFMKRIFSRIQFQLGGANFLKDIPGYCSDIMTMTRNVGWGCQNQYGPGDVWTTGDTIQIFSTQVVEFADPNTINGANSTLIPSLYPDLQLNLGLATLADLCTAGDWDYTFVGNLSVTVEQVTDLQVNVNTLMKEFTQITDITATGNLAIDLTNGILITEMLVVPLVDGVPSNAAIDLTEVFRINVDSGTVILDERYKDDVNVIDYMDVQANYPLYYLITQTGVSAPYLHYNLDFNHDAKNLFDNRQIRKWQLEVPAVFSALTNNQILIHYVGKAPVRS